MGTDVMIRFAREDDQPILVQFNRAMARETESKELVTDIVSAGVDALLKNPELGFYVLAELKSRVVGSLMVTTEWSDWRNGSFWWIQSVYVLPEVRRQGIYRRLYEFVKVESEKNENVCGYRLYVEKDNLAAQRTYTSLGMAETNYKLYEELKNKHEII